MEYNPELVMKRSQSECLSFPSKVFSPSPSKRNSKISSCIAQEIFDFSSQAQNTLLKPRANTTTNIITVKSCEFGSDSSTRYLILSKYFLIIHSEWNSDSNSGSFMRDCESPMGSSKNPFYQDHIFEEVSFELPSRTSNPLVRDADFKRNNKLVGILSHTMVPCGPNTSNL